MTKLTKVAQAYERSKVGRDALCQTEGARCMETTEDKCGIVWERWLVPVRTHDKNGMPEDRAISLIIVATPFWWDIYQPMTNDQSNDATIAALKALAIPKPRAA